MNVSLTKSSYTIFSKSKKKLYLKLNLFNHKLPSANTIKFLGIILDNKLSFNWRLSQCTLNTLCKTLIGSIIDYSFPCLNLLSNKSNRKLQVIQNTTIRSILKLKMDTLIEQLHHLALGKLKTQRIDNRYHLFDLSEDYIRCGLKNSVPLVTRLVKE
ncbi:hypothetical protein BpHYR1_034472 [Brachionus plicatilis]|uniref:RNA-directed DNA polymerase from mobile element jockey-like n=1 Tax=Brachionus plicatilis TaxID=10195 RepID=A0A3M7PEE5_BRAPC|nr:hypothetical protein BpHYR1_034472 [Brachionus plicatilis]